MESRGYVITDNIRYEERILGPLNLRQSIYAFIALLAGGYVWFHSPLSTIPRLLVSLALVAGFTAIIEFNLDQKLSDFIRYLRLKKKVSWLDPEIQKFFNIGRIENDTVFQNDGRILGVIRVDPIDYLILSDDERDAVINGFRRFLNSLSSPIQIVMRSVALNMDGYLANLKDTVVKSGDEQKLDYYNQLESFLKNKFDPDQVGDREYYIIVPSTSLGSEEDMVRNLDSVCRSVLNGLSQANLSAKRLDNEDLIGLYGNFFTQQFHLGVDYYSPVTVYGRMKELNELDEKNLTAEEQIKRERRTEKIKAIKSSVGEVSKPEEEFINLLCAPDKIEVGADSVKIEKHHRVLAALGYPRVVEAGWLAGLIGKKLDINLSIHVNPYPVERAIKLLDGEIKKLKTDKYTLESEGKIIPHSIIHKLSDAEGLSKAIQEGQENLFDISMYVDVKAHSEKDLDIAARDVDRIMQSIMIKPRVPVMRMYDAVRSTLPVVEDELGITRTVTSSAVAACFPFVMSSMGEKSGIIFGFNQTNDIPLILDPYKQANPNMLILGTSGAGKSYVTKLMAMREYIEGAGVYVIDPQGEYADLVKSFSGEVIRIAPETGSTINPFDLMGMTFDEKMLSLTSFFRVMLGGLSEPQRALLNQVIPKVYADKGITRDESTWSRHPPTLKDLYAALEPITKNRRDMIAEPALAITNRLSVYIDGALRFLNKQTNIDLNKDIISFDVSGIEDEGKAAVMYLVLEYIYKQMKKSKKRKMVVIDEAWSVMSAMTDERDYIKTIVKTSRKFNLSLLMISQEADDFLQRDKRTGVERGKSVLANTAIKILLKQDSTSIDEVAKHFHLSKSERSYLMGAGIGNALVISQSSRIPIYVQASSEEEYLITTNADELHARNRPREQVTVEKNFSPEEPVHVKAALNDAQKIILSQRGFREVADTGLQRRGRQIYLVNNNSGESDEHFIVQNLIYDHIKNVAEAEGLSTKEISLKKHVDKKECPDITFVAPGKISVGIDVVDGSEIEGDVEKLNQKLTVLRRYKEAFIVVTRSLQQEPFELYCSGDPDDGIEPIPVIPRIQVAGKLEKYLRKNEQDYSRPLPYPGV